MDAPTLAIKRNRLGTELRFLSNQVDYASIFFEIRGPAAARGYFGPTLGEKIKDLFSGYHAFVSTVILALIGAVIYGIPILVILVLLYWLLFGRIGLMKKLWRCRVKICKAYLVEHLPGAAHASRISSCRPSARRAESMPSMRVVCRRFVRRLTSCGVVFKRRASSAGRTP